VFSCTQRKIAGFSHFSYVKAVPRLKSNTHVGRRLMPSFSTPKAVNVAIPEFSRTSKMSIAFSPAVIAMYAIPAPREKFHMPSWLPQRQSHGKENQRRRNLESRELQLR